MLGAAGFDATQAWVMNAAPFQLSAQMRIKSLGRRHTCLSCCSASAAFSRPQTAVFWLAWASANTGHTLNIRDLYSAQTLECPKG